MRRLKKIISNFNLNDLKIYFFFSFLLIITILAVNSFKITEARYETDTEVVVKPTIAFFVVDVESQSGQITLDNLIPSDTPYLFSFDVSNFKNNKKSNVDLTYSIELIVTTNMPLNFKVFKGEGTTDIIDSVNLTSDENGVYYKHLIINGASTFLCDANHTDTYTLWVEYPLANKNDPNSYAGLIDLIDIKIDAEQVV